ncbi:hypothetical protein NEHOM01_2159 [Nematocida homosporus]|uniref:uncharacterized protein n=1 Tax=Nematocida homosporus TaxID=1912981 RepID=UPI00221EC857|nr:uncharacterized protein NEHOM01_2159 [Nematocida homosporus]KAI5187414.1 hypothetical protein NEHOM01_2159 [Nematocida homosporus]
MELERAIEATQEGESSLSAERFIFDHLDSAIRYIGFIDYKEGPKSRKISTIEALKSAFVYKHLAKKLCTPTYLFLLKDIKHNSATKRIPDSLTEMSYEIYAESIKTLLEYYPQDTINILTRPESPCFLSALLKSSDSSHIIDMFPCFFSLSNQTFHQWIDLLISKNFVDMIFQYLHRAQKQGKETQSLFKLLYLLISFTANIFKREFITRSDLNYTCFYQQILSYLKPILSTVFQDKDSINRTAALEVIREIIKTTEYLPKEAAPFPLLLAALAATPTFSHFQANQQTPDVLLRVLILINTITRCIRFKTQTLLLFFQETHFLKYLIHYLYAANTHTLTNEVCSLLNELIYTGKLFYRQALIEIGHEVRALEFSKPTQLFSNSLQRYTPHVSILDRITPAILILYRLYTSAISETKTVTTHKSNPNSSLSLKRFTIIDQSTEIYQLAQELSFFHNAKFHWYRINRILEHEKRLTLNYIRDPPEVILNSEQFARYFCDYISSTLPDYPPSLL